MTGRLNVATLADMDPWSLLQRLQQHGLPRDEALAVAQSQAEDHRRLREVLERVVKSWSGPPTPELSAARRHIEETCMVCGASANLEKGAQPICILCYDNPNGVHM